MTLGVAEVVWLHALTAALLGVSALALALEVPSDHRVVRWHLGAIVVVSLHVTVATIKLRLHGLPVDEVALRLVAPTAALRLLVAGAFWWAVYYATHAHRRTPA